MWNTSYILVHIRGGKRIPFSAKTLRGIVDGHLDRHKFPLTPKMTKQGGGRRQNNIQKKKYETRNPEPTKVVELIEGTIVGGEEPRRQRPYLYCEKERRKGRARRLTEPTDCAGRSLTTRVQEGKRGREDERTFPC